ncbi:MAG: sensor histidine kinase, partial [Polyangiales bacterium]
RGARTFASALLIQLGQLAIVGGGLLLVGHASRYGPAWPAHLVKITVNAAGVTLFVLVARLVAAHEAAAVALVEARAAADAAALDSLRRRLEPHFLFNALNTLRATIRRDPRRARDLVLDLADLYRYLLRQPEDATLADEVAHARHYLEVERARLGDGRLQIRTEIPAALAPLRVPAFLLQPLVENAVRHGIARRAGGGEVCICASRGAAKALCISVEDRSPGPIRFASEPGHGIALDTLRQRLYKRFGAHASLTLYATETGMRAVVRLDLDSIHASPPALERAA